MARQKTNKTAAKRIKLTNPKGNRKAKMLYKQSNQSHLKTKRSSKSKRRQGDNNEVYATTAKNFKRKVINLK